jgi:hypothetical protein
MTARALRVGIVLGGNLVEERTFADAGPITIGQSLRCRLSVPVDGVPHEHTLFVRDQGRLLLHTTEHMTGRLANGDAITMDPKGVVPIERGARGKLQLGDATILFQEVPLPVKAPRPQLPAAVRGTFADRVDRRLAVIVGGSLLVHLAIGGWAWMTEVEQPLFEQPQFAEYRQDTYEIQVPDEVTAPTTQEPGAATPVAPSAQTPAPIVRNPTRVTQAPPQMSTSDAERFAQLLTSGNEQPGGRTEMGNRIPGDELDKQIKDIRDNGRTIGNDQVGFRNRPTEGIQEGGRPVVDGAGEIAQQAPREERLPPHRIDLRPKKRPDGPDPENIVAKIQRDYMPGLMRCYQAGLRLDQTLRGRVAVSFTVTETGKIAEPSAKGVTSEVDGCIEKQMASWRFAVQKDAAGDATDMDVALILALVSNN